MEIEQVVSYLIIGTVLLFILNVCGRLFTDFKNFIRNKLFEEKFKRDAEKYLKLKVEEENSKRYLNYFGVFEFIFEDFKQEGILKQEYYSVVKEKMKTKYRGRNLQFEIMGKLFFSCDNFNIIDNLVSDLVKLFGYFEDINNKKNIKTYLKISLWTKSGITKFKDAQKILSEMNDFNLNNQVIVNDEFREQYEKHNLKLFKFHPQGLVKLIDNDKDFEIYRMLKK